MYLKEPQLGKNRIKYLNRITFVAIFVTCLSLFINQTIICVNRYLARDTSVALELERYEYRGKNMENNHF